MILGLLTFQEFLLFVLIAYASLFIHELGHAVMALLNKSDKSIIHIGKGPRLFKIKIGKLEIKLKRLFIFNFYNTAYRKEDYSKIEQIFMTLSGPLINGVLALVLWLLYMSSWFNPLLFISFLFNLWLFVFNLIPFKIGQSSSDGYTIYKLLFKSYEEEKVKLIE